MISTTTCKRALASLSVCLLLVPNLAQAGDYIEDGKAYFQAPLQWDSQQWWTAGGVLGLTALAYGHDLQLRDYMQSHQGPQGDRIQAIGNSWGEVTGLGGLTMLGYYGLGRVYDNPRWQRLGNQGFEAVVLSGLSTALLKQAFGRLRPYQSTAHDQWFSGGESFPSGHTTAAFALSTVLAEGVDDPGWGRRVLFYSLAGMTAYARMYGSNHWLSDTVLGAGIGISTGLFVVHRNRQGQPPNLLLYPTANGIAFIRPF